MCHVTCDPDARLMRRSISSDIHLHVPGSHQSVLSHLVFDIWSMAESDRESRSSPYLSTPVMTLGLKVLLPSLQDLSITLTKKSHIFKIPSLLCRNLVIDVHLYLGLWPQNYLYATRCPTTSEISRRQSSNPLMPYCYHLPSRGTSFQLSFSSQRSFFIAHSNQSCPETSRAV